MGFEEAYRRWVAAIEHRRMNREWARVLEMDAKIFRLGGWQPPKFCAPHLRPD
jgi:hypothetical protein